MQMQQLLSKELHLKLALLANEITMVDFLRSKEVEIEGNRLRIEELLKLFDDFDQSFPVVEPMGGST